MLRMCPKFNFFFLQKFKIAAKLANQVTKKSCVFFRLANLIYVALCVKNKKSTIGVIGRDRMLLKCEVFSVELLNRKVQI